MNPTIKQELVSIVMPNYNGAPYLEEAVASVCKQSHENWELLIIDDGSTDNSLEIAQKLEKLDPRIHSLQTSEKFKPLTKGPGCARNTGIAAAKGQYMAFLDADDLWYSEKLERQIKAIKNNGWAFVCSPYDIIQKDGSFVKTYSIKRQRRNYNGLARLCDIGCLTALYDRNKVGTPYIPNTPFPARTDLHLWLQVLKEVPYAYTVGTEPLGAYRLVEGSVSANKLKMAKRTWETLRKGETMPLIKALYSFAFYATNGVLNNIALRRKV